MCRDKGVSNLTSGGWFGLGLFGFFNVNLFFGGTSGRGVERTKSGGGGGDASLSWGRSVGRDEKKVMGSSPWTQGKQRSVEKG